MIGSDLLDKVPVLRILLSTTVLMGLYTGCFTNTWPNSRGVFKSF